MSDRDFIGYGRRPPDPQWPGGARLAVNFVINYEEGSEPSVSDGDGASEVRGTEVAASPVPAGDRDLAAESMFEYGSRVGIWRLARLFQERAMPLTVFACARALERNPQVAAWIGEQGLDVCCHGLRWVEHYRMSEQAERAEIRDAVASLIDTTGAPPAGWYCRYGPSINTRALLVEHGGFSYDSDAYNDEWPYWTTVSGQPHLVVPYTQTHNDMKLAHGQIGTGADFFQLLAEAFDMLYAEGATQPRMMSIGLHNRLAGHPGRASGLARFLDHVLAHRDVWITRRVDIANHWRATHPAQD